MKVVGITVLLVGLLCFATYRELRKQTGLTAQEVADLTRQSEEVEFLKKTRRQQERQRRIAEILPEGKSMTSPFIERINQELEQEFGSGTMTQTAILEKLRELSIEEIKMLNNQLASRLVDIINTDQATLFLASTLILLEADPLFLLHDEIFREHYYHQWAWRASTAFQSLLRKDPQAARRYFQNISLEDLQSNKSPFSKIYTQMMGYLFVHDPGEALSYYRIQKERIRNLPRNSSRWQLSSMDQVMPYAELLRSKRLDDPSVSQLLLWACNEAERLGGLDGLLQFSKAWAGPKKSKEEQWQLFLGFGRPITSSKRAGELIEFLTKNEISNSSSKLHALVYNWPATDLKGASHWIKDQPSGLNRDDMIEGQIRHLEWSDPAAVEQWIPLLYDETLRSKHLDAIEEREAPYRN